jgi:hypothetical protein
LAVIDIYILRVYIVIGYSGLSKEGKRINSSAVEAANDRHEKFRSTAGTVPAAETLTVDSSPYALSAEGFAA